jgi:hypothetical protein
MPIYCSANALKSIVSWQFPNQKKERLILRNTPIKVDVFGIPNDIYQASNAFNSYDTGWKLESNYEAIISNLDPDRVHWIEGGGAFNIKSLSSSGGLLYYSSSDSGNDRFEPFSADRRIYLFNGFRFNLIKRQIAVSQRFTTNIYSHPAILWAIEIEDSKGKKFKKVGTGKPTFSVDCGGCGSNQLDCGGCCADCGEIKNKLRAINVRLR